MHTGCPTYTHTYIGQRGIYTRTNTNKRTYRHTGAQAAICIHHDIHTYIHTYIHAHINTYIHTGRQAGIHTHGNAYLQSQAHIHA